MYIPGPDIGTRDGAVKKEVKMPLFMEFLVKAVGRGRLYTSRDNTYYVGL